MILIPTLMSGPTASSNGIRSISRSMPDTRSCLPGMLLLSKGDRIAMNASVETRYPYLDEDVIAFCAGIAPEYKLRGMTEKWILRQVAARILPKQIANRPKTMFRASMASTFLGSHRPQVGRSVAQPRIACGHGIF